MFILDYRVHTCLKHPACLTIFCLFLPCLQNYFPYYRKQQEKRISVWVLLYNLGSTVINKMQSMIRLQPCLLNLLSTEKFPPCLLISFEFCPSCLLNRSCSLNYFLKIIHPACSESTKQMKQIMPSTMGLQ